ncbi:MAG: hypothetical protein NVSMB17_02130 [Candidatus Dormibacteria bacterium]
MRNMASPPITPADPEMRAGETVLTRAEGVMLGWQLRTVVIWWLPGLVFIALAQVEFRSWLVTLGLFVFCAALFVFYASDSEVRPRGSRKHYLLTDQRVLIGAADRAQSWRTVELAEVATTRMEKSPVDRAVARLSGAATIVLEMRDPGPKGEPRKVRIGPMREPDDFRTAIDLRLSPLRLNALR